MGQRITSALKHALRRRVWIGTIALAAAIPLTFAIPVIAQEVDPLDAMRAEFDACIASGVEGSVCAEGAKLYLDAIISGNDPVTTSTGSPADAAPAGPPAGSQTSSASGQDGEVSRGGDPAITDDTAGDQSTDPAPVSAATPAPPPAAPPPVDAAPADGTADTAATTDAAPGTTATLSGGAQTHDASGTDGGRPGR
jgi:hypothetical protein